MKNKSLKHSTQAKFIFRTRIHIIIYLGFEQFCNLHQIHFVYDRRVRLEEVGDDFVHGKNFFSVFGKISNETRHEEEAVLHVPVDLEMVNYDQYKNDSLKSFYSFIYVMFIWKKYIWWKWDILNPSSFEMSICITKSD